MTELPEAEIEVLEYVEPNQASARRTPWIAVALAANYYLW